MRYSVRVAAIVLIPLLGACAGAASPTTPLAPGGGAAAMASAAGADAIDEDAVSPLGSKPVTFKGRLDGVLTQSTPLVEPVVSNVIEGAGHASRLGPFTVDIPYVVNMATQATDGAYEFAFAKGDTLTIVFSGQGSFIVGGVITVAESGTITNGTGRFAGATGTFSANREFVVATGETSGTFAGTIAIQ